MLVLEILLSVLIIPVVIHQIATTYWKRSLFIWLRSISRQYGIDAREYDFFYRKVIAYDENRAVIIFLDEENKEHGHIIGIDEIINCELVIHETNNDTNVQNIDKIDIELQLKTGNKTIAFCLYEKSFFAMLNKRKLQFRAVDWYEKITATMQVNTTPAYQTA